PPGSMAPRALRLEDPFSQRDLARRGGGQRSGLGVYRRRDHAERDRNEGERSAHDVLPRATREPASRKACLGEAQISASKGPARAWNREKGLIIRDERGRGGLPAEAFAEAGRPPRPRSSRIISPFSRFKARAGPF